ncbi:hypothetical protein ACHQM5_022964 [Ranunculus cassubicifolius]
MSLRYMSRALYQASVRAIQASRNLKDSNCSAATSSKQIRKFSTARDSSYKVAKIDTNEKARKAEESFRTVLYLSCWGTM